MQKPTKETEDNLRKAMAENDPILIRSIIVAAGNLSLLEAQRAFDFAIDGGDPYKILQAKDPNFNFLNEKSRWTKEYFFEHTQKMMRNFSHEAFEHYLDVGAKVFPDKVKPESIKTLAGGPEIPEGARIEAAGGLNLIKVGAVVIGIVLFGIIILLASR